MKTSLLAPQQTRLSICLGPTRPNCFPWKFGDFFFQKYFPANTKPFLRFFFGRNFLLFFFGGLFFFFGPDVSLSEWAGRAGEGACRLPSIHPSGPPVLIGRLEFFFLFFLLLLLLLLLLLFFLSSFFFLLDIARTFHLLLSSGRRPPHLHTVRTERGGGGDVSAACKCDHLICIRRRTSETVSPKPLPLPHPPPVPKRSIPSTDRESSPASAEHPPAFLAPHWMVNWASSLVGKQKSSA